MSYKNFHFFLPESVEIWKSDILTLFWKTGYISLFRISNLVPFLRHVPVCFLELYTCISIMAPSFVSLIQHILWKLLEGGLYSMDDSITIGVPISFFILQYLQKKLDGADQGYLNWWHTTVLRTVISAWHQTSYENVQTTGICVMRSMKRDHKSANVNFEIVKYVVDDCLIKLFFLGGGD